MNSETGSNSELLQRIENELRQQLAAIEILGRALTSEEHRRVEALRSATEAIAKAVEALAGIGSPIEEQMSDVIRLKDGRYAASNASYQADLRMDLKGTAIVSMDVFLGSGASRTFLASVRSDPGMKVKRRHTRFGVIAQDEDGNTVAGTMELTPLSDTQATVSLVLDGGLYGLPVAVPVILTATWQAPIFRTVGIEVDQEAGLPGLPSYEFEGRTVTVESCFYDAGIEIVAAGERDAIPKPAAAWDESQLHGLMVQFADETLNRKAWTLHLLLLSEARMSGLLGIMFDTGVEDENGFPRQGAAVFTDPMQGHPAGFERKVLQTVVHELGHALNLAHRFERVVSRADSTSFMNYDWRYMGGSRQSQFWREFKFTFDPDEIRFFRHGPWSAVIPGGAEFHTVNYWSDGTGGYSPYLPEVALQGLSLMLHPPESGVIFDFGQPVILTVELKNTAAQPQDIPAYYLDSKSGFLEVMVRRLGRRRRRLPEDLVFFSPVVTRCWDVKKTTAERLAPGQSMTNNLNLTFGSAGFTFAEPGNYEITAVLSLYDDNQGVERIVKSDPLRIRIGYPHTADDERDAADIFRKDVGYYFALGGSDVLTEAAGRLEEIRKRRQRKAKEITDPLVAYIVRCQAINASREFISYEKGKYKTRLSDKRTAVGLLDQLEATGSRFFDRATIRGNRALRDQLKGK